MFVHMDTQYACSVCTHVVYVMHTLHGAHTCIHTRTRAQTKGTCAHSTCDAQSTTCTHMQRTHHRHARTWVWGVHVHARTRGHTLRCCLPVTAKESVLQQNHVRQPAAAFREQPGLTLLLRPLRRPGREHRLNCSSEHTAVLASTVPSTRECLGKAPAPPEPVWRAVRAHAGRGGQPARSPLPRH